jgi:hypothetical protein
MEKNYFSLETVENTRLTRIFQLIFGIICVGIAVFWMIFKFSQMRTENTSWITIIFIAGFGIYEIWAGLGKAVKFIETSHEKILLRKSPVLPSVEIRPGDIEKIELFPLNVVFLKKTGKKISLRFGVTYPELIETIKVEITEFATLHNIPVEIKKEEL